MGSLHNHAQGLEEAGCELREVVARLRGLAEAEALRRMAAERPAGIAAAQVRAVIATRRLWRASFEQGEGDPAWALLMELLARRLEGSPAPLTALAEAAGVAPTTSLRWLARLQSRDLIARRPDPKDERIILVSLTDEGDDRLRAYFIGALRLSPWVI